MHKPFLDIDVRVPITPWIAMSIGQGISSTIYQETPCVIDITKARKAMMNIYLSRAGNPQLLKQELGRFINECHMPAVYFTRKIMADKSATYGEDAFKYFKDKLDATKDSLKKSEVELLGN